MLFSDHDALRHINTQDKLSSRHAKWASYLQQFTFCLKHKSGTLNRVADALSRKTNLLTPMKTQVIGFELIKDLLDTDSYFAGIMEEVKAGSRNDYTMHAGFFFKGNQLCIPECSLRPKIIKELHTEGHMG